MNQTHTEYGGYARRKAFASAAKTGLCLLFAAALFAVKGVDIARSMLGTGLVGKEYARSTGSLDDELMQNSETVRPEDFIGFLSDYPEAMRMYDLLYKSDKGSDSEGEKTPPSSSDGGKKSLGSMKIINLNLSRSPAEGEILLSNATKFTPDVNALLKSRYPSSGSEPVMKTLPQNEPLVLIVHTHGTEGYAAEDVISYDQNNLPRSTDIENNVVAVGKVLAETLCENGVPTIHCEIMHDKDSYIKAYDRERETILKYLAEYPSIKYVFDVHRDAIFSSNNEIIKTAVEHDGENLAQIMFVVGTNEAGANHPNWTQNLALAAECQYRLNKTVTEIARPIGLRSASFNEQYTSGSLLIEIGTCGNTLGEAKRSARVLGEILSDVIRSA